MLLTRGRERRARAAAVAVASWTQAVAAMAPPGPPEHLAEVARNVRALVDAPGRWWRERQAARDRMRGVADVLARRGVPATPANVHSARVDRALVGGHLGIETGGLPIDEDER
jgi:hypothetical protein